MYSLIRNLIHQIIVNDSSQFPNSIEIWTIAENNIEKQRLLNNLKNNPKRASVSNIFLEKTVLKKLKISQEQLGLPKQIAECLQKKLEISTALILLSSYKASY